jgi:uncharacterized OB-fold protein
MPTQTAATPPRVLGLYDEPFWRHMKDDGRMHLQCCCDCGAWRYPPGPACHACLSPASDWKPVSGGGELLSWVTFHKQYLPAYPAPYNVIAVRLDEGPTLISNLIEDPEPDQRPIGRRVRLKVVAMADGVALPRFEFAD